MIGGGECRRPYVEALIHAVQASKPASPIFLFTEAPPSDASRVPVLEALAAVKRVKIFPILTPSDCEKCKSEQQPTATSSGETDLKIDRIASITGGQVLRVNPSDIKAVLTLATLSAIGTNSILFYAASTTSPSAYTFPVDKKISEVTISVNSASDSVASMVKTPRG